MASAAKPKRKPLQASTKPEADTNIVFSERRRGRGSLTNQASRYNHEKREVVDDGWDTLATLPAFQTAVQPEQARTIITTNDSPDIPFKQSINAYRGCEHGCCYCYARPTHAWLGHSPGLDFETRLYAKQNAAALLRRELSKPNYVVSTIALGTNTDPYQPIERHCALTRDTLTVLAETRHPVTIVTKSALVLRDLDILQRLAADNLVTVALSLTTLDRQLSRKMEPRAASPHRRLEALHKLSAAAIPTHVLVAPIIPALNDHEIEAILEAAATAGASRANYVLLRLPLELKDLFRQWLAAEFPDRADRVMNLLKSMHAGADYRASYGARQRGSGPYADQIAARFAKACRRLNLTADPHPLSCDLFDPPTSTARQLDLL